VSNCNCGWLPLLLLGLLGLAAAARAAAGCRCCSGWLPLLAAAAARAGAAGCRCVPVPPRSPHARTSSTAASRLALAAPLAARAGAAGCRCCSGWCCWLPLLLGRARRPNFLATNFLATNFHSTGQLRLDRSADRSINRGNPRHYFLRRLVRKAKSSTPRTAEANRARARGAN
jgi:hypothetical protein